MAALLVDSYADDFHPEQHQDSYREELQQLIDAKLEGEEAFPEAPVAEGEDAEVLDLLAALQRSVQRNKGNKDDGQSKVSSGKAVTSVESESDEQDDTAPPKKTRARKTAAPIESAKPKRASTAAKTSKSA